MKNQSELIKSLLYNGYLRSKNIVEVLSNVDRSNFCPTNSNYYDDCPQYLGYGV